MNLKAEDESLRNVPIHDSALREAADYSTHAAVYNASQGLGVSEDLAIWSIVQYGERNNKIHRDPEALRAERDFQQLAQLLSADMEDIDLVFSEFRLETDKQSLKLVIAAETERWFRARRLDDPKTWIPRENLISEYEKLQAEKWKPSEAKQSQAHILHDKELRISKAARRKARESNPENSSEGRKKRYRGPRGRQKG